MKKTKVALISVVFATLTAGINSAYALDIEKLCGNFKFMDSDMKIYRGNFHSGETTLEHALVIVEETDSNRAFVLYVHGTQSAWDIKKPDCYPRFGKMKNRKLTIYFGGGVYQGNV